MSAINPSPHAQTNNAAAVHTMPNNARLHVHAAALRCAPKLSAQDGGQHEVEGLLAVPACKRWRTRGRPMVSMSATTWLLVQFHMTQPVLAAASAMPICPTEHALVVAVKAPQLCMGTMERMTIAVAEQLCRRQRVQRDATVVTTQGTCQPRLMLHPLCSMLACPRPCGVAIALQQRAQRLQAFGGRAGKTLQVGSGGELSEADRRIDDLCTVPRCN